MRKVIFISCVSKKLEIEAKVENLYISDLFKKNLAYSKILNPDETYILSAKYGLLKLDDKIKPYDVTLNHMKVVEKKKWSKKVLNQIKLLENIENTNFIFLAGENYRKYLIPCLSYYETPLKGLRIGKQLQFLKGKIQMNKACSEIHTIFNMMERFNFPFDESLIPKNGIYILYEKSELGHDGDRVIRIGTHTGENQLRSRIKQHFINEKKDRSIFRKNIGRALLNKTNDNFIEQWEWDLTTRKNKDKYTPLLDEGKQVSVEHRVSEHIQNKMSFVTFEVQEKKERLQLESRIISTVSLCKECGSSKDWLGNCSTKDKIKESGLWLVNELYKKTLEVKDIERIKKLCKINS